MKEGMAVKSIVVHIGNNDMSESKTPLEEMSVSRIYYLSV